MTLTEYLNQTNPEFMPYVKLQDGEYSISKPTIYKGEPIQFVSIPQFTGQYAKWGKSNQLWTCDSDGNPKKCSCFWV